MKEFLRDQRGAALAFLLALIPLLLLTMAYAVNYVQAVSEADVDVQRALEQAAKAAAMMVTGDSQAAGRPKIHSTQAYAAFKKELAANLGLNESTLQPLAGSAVKSAPDYVLVVYNGDNDFSGSGAYRARKYRYWGGVLTVTGFSASGFPCRFGVTSTDVLPGGGGTYGVTLDMPGAVAVVNTSVKKIMGRDSISPVRYAAAKIACPAGTCGP